MGNGRDATGSWLQLALERLLAAEHRQTATEWTAANHEKRIGALEADHQMVRDALLRLFRGIAAVSLTYVVDHALSGGALLRGLAGLFVR